MASSGSRRSSAVVSDDAPRVTPRIMSTLARSSAASFGQHAEVGSLLEDVVDLYEDVADRAGGGDRYLVAALQEHVLAGQGGRVVQGRGPVAALGRPLDALGHRHQAMVVLHLPTARVRDCPG